MIVMIKKSVAKHLLLLVVLRPKLNKIKETNLLCNMNLFLGVEFQLQQSDKKVTEYGIQ